MWKHEEESICADVLCYGCIQEKYFLKNSIWNFPFISIFEHLAKQATADVMRQFHKLEENLIKSKVAP